MSRMRLISHLISSAAHPQAYDLESFAHAFTAFLFWVTAISRALEIFAGTAYNSYRAALWSLDDRMAPSGA
jgi:hypothetical protein